MSRTYQDAVALLGLLCERFPQCFMMFQKKRRPLKIHIDRDIATRLGDAADPATLSLALRLYCDNLFYRMGQKHGVPRIDLDGNEVGTVSEADARSAAADVAARRARFNAQARKPAAAASEPPKPPAPPEPPKRLGLSDLRAAAARRKAKQAGDQTPADADAQREQSAR